MRAQESVLKRDSIAAAVARYIGGRLGACALRPVPSSSAQTVSAPLVVYTGALFEDVPSSHLDTWGGSWDPIPTKPRRRRTRTSVI